MRWATWVRSDETAETRRSRRSRSVVGAAFVAVIKARRLRVGGSYARGGGKLHWRSRHGTRNASGTGDFSLAQIFTSGYVFRLVMPQGKPPEKGPNPLL